jgi:hypothetical protein
MPFSPDAVRRPAPIRSPSRSDERRRHPRRPSDANAILRMGAGVALFGRVVDVSQGGACIQFPGPVRGRVGEWVVLDGDPPFRHGFDVSVVAIEAARWRLAFDPALVVLGIFAADRDRPARGRDGAHIAAPGDRPRIRP